MNTAAIASLPRRFFHGWVALFRHLLPPTLYFFVAFNLIVFTTNLLAHNYWFNLGSFILASTTALIVGKVVLVVDKVRIIDKFRGAPLIQPILYKTIFYCLVVTIVRFLEKIVGAAFDAGSLDQAAQMVLVDFTWHRFVAVQVWFFVCFLLYVTASELNALVGDGQLRRLFFHHRSSEYSLTRRQHIRALMEISRLARDTPHDRLLDPATPQGNRLAELIDRLRRRNT
ncbi:MAG: hypothetical protein HQ465_14845 [Rhodospirillales bacterium]|nr:hypothetical protein [Rhodospirillales bacterium]